MSYTRKYLLLGVLAGLFFPLVATVIFISQNELGFSWNSVVRTHQNALLIIIDSAPFVLGFLGYLIGKKQERLSFLYSAIKQDNLLKNDRLDVLNEKLRERNEDLNAITYVATHELKTSLRGIAISSSFLQDDQADPSEIENYRALQKSRIERMDEQLNALMKYIRVTQKEDKLIDLHLTPVIAEVSNEKEFGTVEFEIQKNMPKIKFDQYKFRLIIHELFLNAKKFSNKEYTLIQVEAKSQGPYVSLIIKDNGVGMDPQYVDKVMSLFTTLERKDVKENVGLGLSLIRRIMNDVGGKISLTPGVSEGMMVELCIPN